MDDLPKTSYYKTLGVPKDATLATIRSAYRKLVLSCHPDKTQDEAEKAVRQEKFHEVQEAYETLSDESKRHKYDEKVKLAELRAERTEILGERSATRRTDDYYGASRTGVPPRYDMYDGVRYEVRVPPSNPRTYDRDTYTAEYPEERRPTGKYDDHYSSRRTSGRGSEDKRRTREVEEERERERRRKEREREAYARDSRKRDKDRKKDYEAKSSKKFSAHVDDEDSDSELDDRYYKTNREPAPKARYEEPRKRSGDEGQRKSNKRDSKEYADSDLELKTGAVKDYIKNNKSREAVEPEPSRRPAHTRTTSKLETRTSQPPPPSYPIADSAKRSSGRGRGGSRAASPIRSTKDRRTPEKVETSSRGKNNVSTISSAAKGMKSFISASSTGRGAPHRSATYQDTTEYRPKPLQRSETMPVDRMHRGETRPLQTSTLKNMKASSDYSGSSSESESEVTEEIYTKPRRPSPRQKSTSYRYTENEGDKFVLEPEEIPVRRSEESSSNHRRPSLPLRGSTARAPTTGRSMPYLSDERLPRQNYTRTESARAPPSQAQHSPKLYREYSPPHEESQRAKHSSPKLYTDEVRHADKYVRRGSEDPGYRDAWPGKFRRPNMPRNETTVQ